MGKMGLTVLQEKMEPQDPMAHRDHLEVLVCLVQWGLRERQV